jgi:hypothetical protein
MTSPSSFTARHRDTVGDPETLQTICPDARCHPSVAAAPKPSSGRRAKPLTPLPDGFIGDCDVPLRQQIP